VQNRTRHDLNELSSNLWKLRRQLEAVEDRDLVDGLVEFESSQGYGRPHSGLDAELHSAALFSSRSTAVRPQSGARPAPRTSLLIIQIHDLTRVCM
jgi:hypothetical protein